MLHMPTSLDNQAAHVEVVSLDITEPIEVFVDTMCTVEEQISGEAVRSSADSSQMLIACSSFIPEALSQQ